MRQGAVRATCNASGVPERLVRNDLLGFLVEWDSRRSFTLVFDGPSGLIDGLSGRDLDDALLEGTGSGLVTGDRGEGDGSIAWWSRLRLTVAGMRTLGQWPPAGREWGRAGWDERYWGRRARPLLIRLSEDPQQHGFFFKPIGGDDEEAWRDWTALLLLAEADLISGRLTDSGVDTLRVTEAGRRALDPTPRDPLDEADAKLRGGSRVDAVVDAVERGLGDRLRALAVTHGMATAMPARLSRLNDELRRAGAYGEAERAQVEAWLKLRNDLAHGRDDAISDSRVAVLIEGIRVFLSEHPA